jgi:hypothetical protein
LALDQGENRGHSPDGPQTCSGRLDPASGPPTMAPKDMLAVTRILSHMIALRLQPSRRLELLDYTDFLRRARWKRYTRTSRRPKLGRYLDVLYCPLLGIYNLSPLEEAVGGKTHLRHSCTTITSNTLHSARESDQRQEPQITMQAIAPSTPKFRTTAVTPIVHFRDEGACWWC